MPLRKQRKNESDADYAVRLEKAKEAARRNALNYYRAHREAILVKKREYDRGNKEAKKRSDRRYYEANREARKEYDRKRRAANKEAKQEYNRRYYAANREARKEYQRNYNTAKILDHAKGKPLTADLRRAHRPQLLTKLVIKVAEDFCRNHGFPLERKWDSDVLKHAAKTIRDSPELDGTVNPWYGTDYLHPAAIGKRGWAGKIKKRWRDME